MGLHSRGRENCCAPFLYEQTRDERTQSHTSYSNSQETSSPHAERLLPHLLFGRHVYDYSEAPCDSTSKKMLLDLISENRTVFIKGRHILENISFAQEFFGGFHSKSTPRWAMWSIDFTKAFHTLRWEAIDFVLGTMGIDSAFRELIRSCFSTTSFVVLVEGSSTMMFAAKRRVYQGDHLTSSFFITLEYHSWRLSEEVDREG